jgi:hypothetical protein
MHQKEDQIHILTLLPMSRLISARSTPVRRLVWRSRSYLCPGWSPHFLSEFNPACICCSLISSLIELNLQGSE